MRGLVALMLVAGCGRIGYRPQPARDAASEAPTADRPGDAARDELTPPIDGADETLARDTAIDATSPLDGAAFDDRPDSVDVLDATGPEGGMDALSDAGTTLSEAATDVGADVVDATTATCPPRATRHDEIGLGTSLDPFVLCTAAQVFDLQMSPSGWSSVYRVDRDIDLGGAPSTPIGTMATPFRGEVRGGSTTIRGLFIDGGDATEVGLFGVLTGRVQDLGVVAMIRSTPSTTAGVAAGVIAGRAINATIDGANVSGVITLTPSTTGVAGALGGVVGFLADGQITRTHANVAIAGNPAMPSFVRAGGIVGETNGPSVRISEVTLERDVLVEGSVAAGGIAGAMAGGVVENIPAGNPPMVRGVIAAGGIAGLLSGGTLRDIKAAANVDAIGSDVGGAVGLLGDGSTIVRVHIVVERMVSRAQHAGGIAGQSMATTDVIAESSARGTIDTLGFHAGGLVGLLAGTVSDSYANVFVGPTARVAGGIAGGVTGGGAIRRCYANGGVSATGPVQNVGGLAGELDTSSVIEASWSRSVLTGSLRGGIVARIVTGAAGPATILTSKWDSTSSTVSVMCGDATNILGCNDADVVSDPADFFVRSTAPMTMWTFPPWVEETSQPPSLASE